MRKAPFWFVAESLPEAHVAGSKSESAGYVHGRTLCGLQIFHPRQSIRLIDPTRASSVADRLRGPEGVLLCVKCLDAVKSLTRLL